mgnify:CR=1 FL=1
MVYRVFVEKRQGLAQEAESLCGELRNFLGLTDLTGVRMLNRYDAEGLTAEDFSVPLFGRVYAALRERWQNDLAITPAALADSLSPAEMAHLTAVLQKQEPPLSETALADYLRILREERAKARVSDASDLLAMQRDLKKKKGYGGS